MDITTRYYKDEDGRYSHATVEEQGRTTTYERVPGGEWREEVIQVQWDGGRKHRVRVIGTQALPGDVRRTMLGY